MIIQVNTFLACFHTFVRFLSLRKDILSDILNINYSKDINIVKEILIKRINLYNKNNEYKDFNISIIDDDILEYLIEKTNGNLDIMIKLL